MIERQICWRNCWISCVWETGTGPRKTLVTLWFSRESWTEWRWTQGDCWLAPGKSEPPAGKWPQVQLRRVWPRFPRSWVRLPVARRSEPALERPELGPVWPGRLWSACLLSGPPGSPPGWRGWPEPAASARAATGWLHWTGRRCHWSWNTAGTRPPHGKRALGNCWVLGSLKRNIDRLLTALPLLYIQQMMTWVWSTGAECFDIYLRYRRLWTSLSDPALRCWWSHFRSLFWSSWSRTSHTWTWPGEKTFQLLCRRQGQLWCRVWRWVWPWCREVSTLLSLSPVRPPVPSPPATLIHCDVWRPGALSSHHPQLFLHYSNYPGRSGPGQDLVRVQLHFTHSHLIWWERTSSHYCSFLFSSLRGLNFELGEDLSPPSVCCPIVTLWYTNTFQLEQNIRYQQIIRGLTTHLVFAKISGIFLWWRLLKWRDERRDWRCLRAIIKGGPGFTWPQAGNIKRCELWRVKTVLPRCGCNNI